MSDNIYTETIEKLRDSSATMSLRAGDPKKLTEVFAREHNTHQQNNHHKQHHKQQHHQHQQHHNHHPKNHQQQNHHLIFQQLLSLYWQTS